MSNYPTLSTIIDKNGNSYSKGLNQIFNGNFMNNFSSWSSWGNHSGAVREIVTINNKKWLHIKSIKDPWFGLNQGINGTTTNSPVLMPNCLMRASFTCMVSSDTINQSAIGLECKVYNTDGTTINPRYVMSTNWGQWSIYPTPKRHSWTFTTTPNPSHFWLSLGKFQGSDVVEAWFTDIMVEYIEDGSQPLSDYRPNPADLAGGGYSMPIIARSNTVTLSRVNDGADAFTISYDYPNGLEFTDAIKSITITAKVFKGGKELTDAEVNKYGSIIWRNSKTNASVGTGKTITLTSPVDLYANLEN